MIPYSAKLQHEALCNFRHYNCPYAGVKCPVTGDIPLLVTHLRAAGHNVEMRPSCTFKYRFVKPNPYAVENATWMLTEVHTPVYMAFVRFMGHEADARNYSYSLEVGPRGNKRSWQGTPRSIRDSPRTVCDSQEGLMIERDMALSFSDGDGSELRLRVTGKIWSIEQNPEGEVFG
ncbi:putative seven-in-absentia protein, TRAF [Helianthus annuus]|nr:putative seven-in-absentia protein, TRAF [Helianthus annuus]KAJ0686522.1 putative seven-in-absentia protein, TRAF [Helianthus annuus]KAJ0690337.1 putative seven-in-absentia protein, TRAF [Helianthus annuus]KAJ0871856.1 putative seven-in-absentia protein, TRAF [Helianthus annuus]